MKYRFTIKKVVMALLIAGSMHQNSVMAKDNDQQECSPEIREAFFDHAINQLMTECLFNLEIKKPFMYYRDALLKLAGQREHATILQKRLAINRSTNTAKDFLRALGGIKSTDSALKIGMILIKYIEILPEALQKSLNDAGISTLAKQLTLRLAVKAE